MCKSNSATTDKLDDKTELKSVNSGAIDAYVAITIRHFTSDDRKSTNRINFSDGHDLLIFRIRSNCFSVEVRKSA